MSSSRRKQKNPRKRQSKRKVVKKRSGSSSSRKKSVCFKSIVSKLRRHIERGRPRNLGDALILAAKAPIKQKKINTPRVIKIPKTGGILPLIPIFAGLSALGALSGGAAGIAKAVNDAQAAKRQLEEARRHNATMESIAIGGRGMYLKPYKTGLGLFLRPSAASTTYR